MDEREPCTCHDCPDCKPALAEYVRMNARSWLSWQLAREGSALQQRLRERGTR